MELPDQKIWEISKLLYNEFKKDEFEKRLDLQSLEEFKKNNVQPLYPRKIISEGDTQRYSCHDACCEVNPGTFCLCNSTKPDESFRKLGLGMCLYFKFMKQAIWVLMLIAFLSLISCLLCFLIGASNGFSPMENYSTFFSSSTLGTFSSEHMKCDYKLINSISNKASFTLSCPYGEVKSFGVVFTSESDNSLFNCRNEIKKYLTSDQTYATSAYITSGNTPVCNQNKSSCQMTIEFTATRPSFSIAAYSFECLNQVYQLGSVRGKSQYILYYIISIDLFCCLVIFSFYCSEAQSQQKEIRYFKTQELNLCDFSLKVKGFNISTFEQEFDNFMKTLAQTEQLGQNFQQQIVQVKTPDREDFLQYQQAKEQAYNKLKEYIEQHIFDKEIDPNQCRDSQQFLDKFSQIEYNRYRAKLFDYVKCFAMLQYKPNLNMRSPTVSIYIVLRTRMAKWRLYRTQQKGCFSRFLRINDREYSCSQPPPPDLIQWKNLGKLTWFRLMISWLVTLGICFSSYLMFGFIQSKQKELLDSYNFKIDCNLLYPSVNLAIFDTSYLSQTNYLTCFCKKNLINFDNPDSYRCSDWRKQYVLYLAIPILISLLLVLYDVVVSFMFKHLTLFECHKFISQQKISYTIKRAFLMIMNMGLIMILLNMKITNKIQILEISFLFEGKYNDFTADWYINIGAIIIMTMIFNIAFPIIELLLANLLKLIKVIWDRKCWSLPTSCRTKTEYLQLFRYDVYPIQQRYAFLISVFLITMAFSCIIPFLYIVCAISIMLLYFADKILIFKHYQKPINYNHELHNLMNKTIFLGLVSHMALTAYFLTEKNMLASNSTLLDGKKMETGNERIDSIINTYYIMPYVIFFIILWVWGFFSSTIIALIERCILACKAELSYVDDKYRNQNSLFSYFDSLNPYQAKQLKMLNQKQISKIATKKNLSSSTENLSSASLDNTLRTINDRKISQHEAILRRTLKKLNLQDSSKRKKANQPFLVGQPSYQLILNEQSFEQDKRNMALSQSLNNSLRNYLEYFRDD